MAERTCPTCGKPAVEEFRPFCSRRCADVDLDKLEVIQFDGASL